jgi:hypothetical protein
MVVSGNVVSPREYYRRVRGVIESTRPEESLRGIDISIKEILMIVNEYIHYPLSFQEIKEYEVENIYLVNVQVF